MNTDITVSEYNVIIKIIIVSCSSQFRLVIRVYGILHSETNLVDKTCVILGLRIKMFTILQNLNTCSVFW